MKQDSEIRRVVIGIQARSTSNRFPRKVHEMIGDRSMLQHVIDAAYSSMTYINHWSKHNKLNSSVVLCVPKGDEIVKLYGGKIPIYEGSESDVLSRYFLMAQQTHADLIVRLTSDCPLIPANLISKTIQCAMKENYDYVSNVDPDFRTAPDGMDCEVMSMKALAWCQMNATQGFDKEHVTTFIRSSKPEWLKMGFMVGFLNFSNFKVSVDTPEDLERVRHEYASVKNILDNAGNKYGKKSVHRF